MITRELFQERINSFGFSDEQKEKCMMYYDNPSTSKSKEGVIDSANADNLLNTVNRWYGRKNSTKERKPRTSTKGNSTKVIDEVNKYFDKLKAVIEQTNSIKVLGDIISLSCELSSLSKLKEDAILTARNEKYNQAIALLDEYFKPSNKKYKIVLDE